MGVDSTLAYPIPIQSPPPTLSHVKLEQADQTLTDILNQTLSDTLQ